MYTWTPEAGLIGAGKERVDVEVRRAIDVCEMEHSKRGLVPKDYEHAIVADCMAKSLGAREWEIGLNVQYGVP